MKIYSSAPNTKTKDLAVFHNAMLELKKKSHKLLNLYDEGDSVLNHQDVDYFVKKHKQSERSIREADVVIVDVTYPGRRIGYEIARALDERKVVLALYNENSDAPKVATLLGLSSPLFLFKAYNAQTIDSVIEASLNEAKDKLDTKFILIISPEIDKYLTWAADERRMHKAQIVRNAVEEAMNKDKEYKEFRKDQELD